MRNRLRWLRPSTLAVILCALTPGEVVRASEQPIPAVNVIEWDGGDLPPVYERSDQLPLSLDDVAALGRAGFPASQVIRMVQERRFAGDASAEALIGLKREGLTPEVLQAISLHALPPNRSLNLSIELSFDGTPGEARRRYLYVILPDGPQERIFTADLGAVLSGHWKRDVLVDQTDLLLPRKVRRVTFASEIPMKAHGQKKLLVLTSTRPDIYTSRDIPESDRPGVQEFRFDYPVSSPRRDCLLQVRYRQDVALAHKWDMVRSHLQCEWD